MHSCDLIRDSEFEVNQAGVLCTDRLQVITYRISRTPIEKMHDEDDDDDECCCCSMYDRSTCRIAMAMAAANADLQCHCFTLVSSFVLSSATCCVVLYTCFMELVVHMACRSSVGVPCRRRFEVVEKGVFLGCNLPET